jgi:hypothetical protein
MHQSQSSKRDTGNDGTNAHQSFYSDAFDYKPEEKGGDNTDQKADARSSVDFGSRPVARLAQGIDEGVKNIKGHPGGHKMTEEGNDNNIPAIKEPFGVIG